ncbi:hypothetical protein K1719_034533 [Acacia pycnantha]|nr:hypothetical protein K1719_034533 [Acacia pycnantha]
MDDSQISTPLVWKEVESVRILVGKILTSKIYTRSTMETILNKAWNLQSGFEVLEIIGNAFLFKFVEEEDYFRVLRGRPWSINGCLLNLLERSKYKAYDEFNFSRCPIWIQMHNIPLEALCLENAITIGRQVGEVILAEDPSYNNRYLRNFLRARIILDLRKPLAYGYWLPRPDGRRIWIAIRYEKLQTFCYHCGLAGHDNRGCKSTKLMSITNATEPRYGAWITTTTCRFWEETLTVLSKDEAEAAYVSRRKEDSLRRTKMEEQRKSDRAASEADEDIFSICICKSGKGSRSGDPVDEGTKVSRRNINTDTSDAQELALLNNQSAAVVNKKLEEELLNNAKACYEPSSNMGEGAEGRHRAMTILQPLIPERLSQPASPDNRDDSRALVLYCDNEFKEMVSGIGSLGLKRSAEEDWVSGVRKKTRVDKEETSPMLDITNYANNLKKVKARLRRSERKKKLSLLKGQWEASDN